MKADFFQILWPYQNVCTLTALFFGGFPVFKEGQHCSSAATAAILPYLLDMSTIFVTLKNGFKVYIMRTRYLL